MTRSFGPRLLRRREGQAMAELALILPIVLFFLIAIIELGSAFRVFQVVVNSAREGARAGVVPTGDSATVANRVSDYLSQNGLNPASASILQSCTGTGGACSSGSELEVSVEFPFAFRSLGPVMNLVCGGCGSGWGTIPLRSTAVMRNE